MKVLAALWGKRVLVSADCIAVESNITEAKRAVLRNYFYISYKEIKPLVAEENEITNIKEWLQLQNLH